jgi:MoaA/NifB/PqqE/SkfB family radical SAM enzyme
MFHNVFGAINVRGARDKVSSMRIMPWILNRLTAVPLARRVTIQSWFLAALNLPFVSSVYDKLYFSTQVGRKASRLPRVVSIEAYNVCNLKCVMCPYPDMSRPKVKMSMELFSQIVANAVEARINELNLNVYNEPLLDDSLFTRIGYAKSRGMRVGFSTNGTVLTAEKAGQILRSGLDWIIVSIDGASKETFESIRIGADFDDVVRNTRQLVELRNASQLEKPVVTVCCVVQKDNYREFASQPRQFHQLFKGVDVINVGVVDTRRDDKTESVFNLRMRAKAKRVYPCPRLWLELTVLSSGKVALCCMDYDGSVELGDLNRQRIEEVWESTKFRDIRRLHLTRQGTAVFLCSTCDIPYQHGVYGWWKL